MAQDDWLKQRLLVRVGAGGASGIMMGAPFAIFGLGFQLEPLFEDLSTLFDGGPPSEQWMVATPDSENAEVHPWDWAHRALATPFLAGNGADYIEPDLVHEFPYQNPVTTEQGGVLLDAAACQADSPDPAFPDGGSFAWHLGATRSQLAAARAAVGDPGSGRVRVAILDTGYDPQHATLPAHLNAALERNFVDQSRPSNAADPATAGTLKNPGHGTGTLGLLAGNRVSSLLGAPGFADFLGGAPHAEVIPVRIAESVVHFRTSTMAQGIRYTIAPRRQPGDVARACDVVSISMGGVATKLWATVVNEAYEAGVAIFAAAGNNFGNLPTREIVYPARFGRVVAVCGAMADGLPYRHALPWKMQGNYGPSRAMETALAAYTPNMPWAELGCSNIVDRNGAGTSSSTPQAAAAAALWLQQRGAGLPRDWRRVEAVRRALFESADRSYAEHQRYYGRGVLRAKAALGVDANTSGLTRQPPDKVSFPLLDLLTPFHDGSAASKEMMEVEARQLFDSSPLLKELRDEADGAPETLDRAEQKKIAGALHDLPEASNTLKRFLARALPRVP